MNKKLKQTTKPLFPVIDGLQKFWKFTRWNGHFRYHITREIFEDHRHPAPAVIIDNRIGALNIAGV